MKQRLKRETVMINKVVSCFFKDKEKGQNFSQMYQEKKRTHKDKIINERGSIKTYTIEYKKF